MQAVDKVEGTFDATMGARGPLHRSLRPVISRTRAARDLNFLANSRAIGGKKPPCSPSRSARHGPTRVMQRFPRAAHQRWVSARLPLNASRPGFAGDFCPPAASAQPAKARPGERVLDGLLALACAAVCAALTWAGRGALAGLDLQMARCAVKVFFWLTWEALLLPGGRRRDPCGEIVAAPQSPGAAETPRPTRLARIDAFFRSQADLSLTTLVVFLGLGMALLPVGWNYTRLQAQTRLASQPAADMRIAAGDSASWRPEQSAPCHPPRVFFPALSPAPEGRSMRRCFWSPEVFEFEALAGSASSSQPF